MRATSILSEAWRNLWSGTSHGAALSVIVAVAGASLALLDADAVDRIADQAERFRERGGAVWITEAAGAIDGLACDRLQEVQGVAAAGALTTSRDSLTFSSTPRTPIAIHESTTGFIRLLTGSGRIGEGLMLSDNLAERHAVDAGDSMSLVGPDARSAGAFPYPADGRRPGLEYSAVLPGLSTENFDQCWTEVWPSSASTRTLGRLAVEPGNASETETYQLNSMMGVEFTANEMYRNRSTRYVSLLALLLGATIGYASIKVRRLELASAFHLGVERTALVTMILVETLAWSACAGVMAVASTQTLARAGVVADGVPAQIAMQPVAWSVIGVVAGAIAATARIRQRDLLISFKNR